MKIPHQLTTITYSIIIHGNSGRGYTCGQSCGCVICGKCFFYQPSCLFYGVYAAPTTSTIINVLAGSDAKRHANMSATIQLHPRQRRSVIGTIVQIPILSSTFAETDDTISIVEPDHRVQLALHTVGRLQRSGSGSAAPSQNNVCKCNSGLRKVTCSCSPSNISDFMGASLLLNTMYANIANVLNTLCNYILYLKT